MTDLEVLQTRNDVEMIKRHHLWPIAILPLKKADSFADGGLGYIWRGRPTRVFIGLMFEDPRSLPFKDYASPEAIVADGWLVD